MPPHVREGHRHVKLCPLTRDGLLKREGYVLELEMGPLQREAYVLNLEMAVTCKGNVPRNGQLKTIWLHFCERIENGQLQIIWLYFCKRIKRKKVVSSLGSVVSFHGVMNVVSHASKYSLVSRVRRKAGKKGMIVHRARLESDRNI